MHPTSDSILLYIFREQSFSQDLHHSIRSLSNHPFIYLEDTPKVKQPLVDLLRKLVVEEKVSRNEKKKVGMAS